MNEYLERQSIEMVGKYLEQQKSDLKPNEVYYTLKNEVEKQLGKSNIAIDPTTIFKAIDSIIAGTEVVLEVKTKTKFIEKQVVKEVIKEESKVVKKPKIKEHEKEDNQIFLFEDLL